MYSHCAICLQQGEIAMAVLPCEYQLCLNCVQNYINSYLANCPVKSIQATPSLVPCCSTRGHSHLIGQYLKLLAPERRAEVDSQLVRKVLQNHSQVMACPNPHCSQYYFIQDSYFSCDQHCECGARVIAKSNYLQYSVYNLLSIISTLMQATFCPDCMAPAIRLKGCNHVKCHCQTDYCYICGEYWCHPTEHTEQDCMRKMYLKVSLIFVNFCPLLLCLINVPIWDVVLELGCKLAMYAATLSAQAVAVCKLGRTAFSRREMGSAVFAAVAMAGSFLVCGQIYQLSAVEYLTLSVVYVLFYNKYFSD